MDPLSDASDRGAFLWSPQGIRPPTSRETKPPKAAPNGQETPPSEADQRLFPRIDLELPILYKVMGDEPTTLSAVIHPDLPAVSDNVSAKGVCMVLAERIPQGTVLGLSIHLAGEKQKVTALARVVWSRPTETPHHFLTGLTFISVYRKTGAETEVMDATALHKLFSQP